MSDARTSAESTPRTPDRIAADALLERAVTLEDSGYPDAAQELRERAERLLGAD
ncbi:hypothetical protein [Mycolicibacterium conceptionense]|uniref:hypothetical protein n=1 Tax=Mycolicibacterium conceptionense TaxID=451644 RepID=UPI000A51BD0A|nr:hypothetical protein [Mycolicibacterium conceptionense]